MADDVVDGDEESVLPSVAESAESESTALCPPAKALAGMAITAKAAKARRTMDRRLRADMVMGTFQRGQFPSKVRRHRDMSSTT